MSRCVELVRLAGGLSGASKCREAVRTGPLSVKDHSLDFSYSSKACVYGSLVERLLC
jgi:hypothetical protein